MRKPNKNRRRRWLSEEAKWGIAILAVWLLYSAALVCITRDLTIWLGLH